MTIQFTVIITENPKKARIQIKNNHDKVRQKAETYFKTPTQSILLRKPRRSALRDYQADVVVNETRHTNLSKIAAKPEGIIVNTETEDSDIDFQQKLQEKLNQEHKTSAETKTGKSGNRMIYRCEECGESLGTREEIEEWFNEEIL